MAGVSVEKRGDTWRYRFDTAKIGGKRHRVQKGGFATKREAQAAGAAAFAEYNNCGLVFKPSEVSYADYLDYWLEEYCVVNLKVGTVNTYRANIKNYIKPKFGAYRLTQLTPTALQSVINEMFNEGYARNTLKSVRGLLRKSLSYAVEPAQFIRDSPALYIQLPLYNAMPEKPTRSNPHIYVEQEQMDRILELYPQKSNSHIPLLLGYRCGMRKGEIYGLMVEDIDFEKKKIHIHRQMQKDHKSKQWYMTAPKYNSYRTIDVDDNTLRVLADKVRAINLIRERLGEDMPRYYIDTAGIIQSEGTGTEIHPLNRNAHGVMMKASAISQCVESIREKLKMPDFDFHSLRHTHATMLAEAGAPFKFIQLRLGHKTVEVTLKTYQHVSPTISAQGVDTLQKIYVKKERPESSDNSQLSGTFVPTE